MYVGGGGWKEVGGGKGWEMKGESREAGEKYYVFMLPAHTPSPPFPPPLQNRETIAQPHCLHSCVCSQHEQRVAWGRGGGKRKKRERGGVGNGGVVVRTPKNIHLFSPTKMKERGKGVGGGVGGTWRETVEKKTTDSVLVCEGGGGRSYFPNKWRFYER